MITEKNSIFVLCQNPKFELQVRYIFNLFLGILGISYRFECSSMGTNYRKTSANPSSLLISYGKRLIETNQQPHIHIYSSNLFSEVFLKPESLPKTPLPRYKDIPILYSANSLRPFVMKKPYLIETNIDIVASSFFMLSRYEELLISTRDKFGRFPATASYAYKEAFLDIPVVNQYLDLLWHWVKTLLPSLKRKSLWSGKTHAVCLTHDVDTIRKYAWYNIPGYIYTTIKNPSSFKTTARDSFRCMKRVIVSSSIHKDPYDSFDYIMDVEDKIGLKSAFYFMAFSRDFPGGRYNIRSPAVQNLMQTIQSRNREIGLHGTYNSYNNEWMMKKQYKILSIILRKKALGSRQHYLRWKTPITWQILEKCGLIYDTTLGFPDYEGFRCGFCLPYRPFDVTENRELDIWELPLIVMDEMLTSYRKYTPEKALKRIKELSDTVRYFGGVFVLLWHNSSFDQEEMSGWKNVWEETIRYLADNAPFCKTPMETVLHFQDFFNKKK